ncbi:hypothetical protein [Nicoliella lavandulae]|uniref:Uncharacterized protein n=1 Tax=Nicoliella lavandulae TaxID=3082954 RepID=A0ABU8SM70_9LACO
MEAILFYKRMGCRKTVDVIKDTNIIVSILLEQKNILRLTKDTKLDVSKEERYVDRFKQKKLYLLVEGKTFLVKND